MSGNCVVGRRRHWLPSFKDAELIGVNASSRCKTRGPARPSPAYVDRTTTPFLRSRQPQNAGEPLVYKKPPHLQLQPPAVASFFDDDHRNGGRLAKTGRKQLLDATYRLTPFRKHICRDRLPTTAAILCTRMHGNPAQLRPPAYSCQQFYRVLADNASVTR